MSVTVLEASASWREIGRSYGEQLREPLRRALDAYAAMAPKLGGTLDELRRRIAPYAVAARTWAPTRYAELEGLAEGANISLDDALLLNCIEELEASDACTTAGFDRFLVHAEMWHAGQEDIAVLVAAPDDGPAVVAPSCVGFLTGVGASAAGFAIGVQSAFASDERVGVPRVMPSRDALCAADVQSAVDAACAPQRAGGYGYVISTVARHRILETSATQAALLDERALAVHTNHYLSELSAIATEVGGADSDVRLQSAETAVDAMRLESLEDCQALLCADGFRPGPPSQSVTIFGFACDLETGAVCVSDGDPREQRWTYLNVPDFCPAREDVASGA